MSGPVLSSCSGGWESTGCRDYKLLAPFCLPLLLEYGNPSRGALPVYTTARSWSLWKQSQDQYSDTVVPYLQKFLYVLAKEFYGQGKRGQGPGLVGSSGLVSKRTKSYSELLGLGIAWICSEGWCRGPIFQGGDLLEGRQLR